MKKEYDFSKGKRGAVDPTPPGKTRITIRLDNEIIDWFRDQVEARGGGNYQSMINHALRQYINHRSEDLIELLRSVIRKELEMMGERFEKFNSYLLPFAAQQIAESKTIRNDIPGTIDVFADTEANKLSQCW